MKKVLTVSSILCGVMALVSLITGIQVLSGRGYFVGLAMFSMVRSGTVMGFFGNIVSIALTCGGFGTMAYHGLFSGSSSKSHKNAFVWGCVMTVLCIISLICSFGAGTFNFGDIILTALPAVYTYSLLKTA